MMYQNYGEVNLKTIGKMPLIKILNGLIGGVDYYSDKYAKQISVLRSLNKDGLIYLIEGIQKIKEER